MGMLPNNLRRDRLRTIAPRRTERKPESNGARGGYSSLAGPEGVCQAPGPYPAPPAMDLEGTVTTPALSSPPPASTAGTSVPATREADRVSFKEKVALGSGFLAVFYGNSGVKSLAIPIYQMVLGVNPALLGLVLAIPRFWDALTDPVVGMVSDNWHTRFGRRRPFIVV